MSLAPRLVPLLLVGVLALTGCGAEDPAPKVQASPAADGSTRIDVTFEGDTVDPSGGQVEVEAGKPVILHITADAAGEIHVHSSPEQELEYEAGTSDKTITLDQPGVVDVESHTLDKLIVQLEVR